MQESTSKLLQEFLDYELSSDQWDQMPQLIFLSEDGIVIAAMSGGETYEMINGIAESIRDGSSEIPTENVTGIVLSVEAYSLKNDSGLDPQVEAQKLRMEGKRFSEHPAAVEVKLLSAIDADGLVDSILERGDTKWRTMPSTSSGRVPEAMKNLLAAVTK